MSAVGWALQGVPLLFLVAPQALYRLPIIGADLLFFSTLTLCARVYDEDWAYLCQASIYVLPAALIGIFGLISLWHWYGAGA